MERNKRNRWVEEWRGEGRRKEQSRGRKGHQERRQTLVWISVLRFFAMREGDKRRRRDLAVDFRPYRGLWPCGELPAMHAYCLALNTRETRYNG